MARQSPCRPARLQRVGFDADRDAYHMHRVPRKSKERDAIFVADDGSAPPLSQRGPALSWGHLGGSEGLTPPGLRQVCSRLMRLLAAQWQLLPDNDPASARTWPCLVLGGSGLARFLRILTPLRKGSCHFLQQR